MTRTLIATTLLSAAFCLFAAAVLVTASLGTVQRTANSITIHKNQTWPIAPVVSVQPCKLRTCYSV